MDKIEKETCPVCLKKTLVLTEDEMDIPYFGKTYIFAMKCNECGYGQSDVEGYVSNVEGLLERFKKILESERDNADDEDVRKKAKNLLKRLWKIELGEEKVKMIIEDPSGNSAIISEKAVVSRLKK